MKYIFIIVCILVAGHVYMLQETLDKARQDVLVLEKTIETDIEDCKNKLFYERAMARLNGCYDGMTAVCESIANFDTAVCIDILIKYCKKEE